MKSAIIVTFILTIISAQAWAVEVPTGDFKYTNTQAVSTKHIHRLYQRSSKEKELIKARKEDGYICKRQNSTITDCYKYIDTNPNQIDFTSEKHAKFSPIFSEKIHKIEELSSGELVTIYEVTQDNSLNSLQNTSYKAYDNKDGEFYVDLNIDNFNQVRFSVLNSTDLSRFSFQKEKLNKREHYLHGLISNYIKKTP